MISALSMPCRYTEVMPRLVWPSWRWMTISGTPSRHLDGVGMAQLMRRKAPPHTGPARHLAQLRACRGGRPGPSAGRIVDHVEQRPDRQVDADLQPRRDLFPGPVVHADLAAPAALAAPHQQRPAARVEVGLGERERLVDAQAGAPEHDDQAAQSAAMDAVAGGAHDGHDLLDGRWVCGVADPLVARRPTGVELRQRGG